MSNLKFNIEGQRSVGEFKRMVEDLSAMLASEGIYRMPYVTPQMPYFSALPAKEQVYILNGVTKYHQACEDCRVEGSSLRDAPVLLWKMFKRLGVVPPSDLFSYVTSESVIEIYNDKNMQVFRNLGFFEICSYTLEELFCRPWWELYRRDDSITQQLFKAATNILEGGVRQTIPTLTPTHVLEEKCSPMGFRMDANHEYLSPLTQNGKSTAYCVISSARLHNEPTKDAGAIRDQLEKYYNTEPQSEPPGKDV